MTNEEAIKRLAKIKAIYQGMDNKSDVKALDMAIKALEQTNGDLISRKSVIDAIRSMDRNDHIDEYTENVVEYFKNMPSAEKTDTNHYRVIDESYSPYTIDSTFNSYSMTISKTTEKTAECDNNHDCEHCDWTECPLEVEKETDTFNCKNCRWNNTNVCAIDNTGDKPSCNFIPKRKQTDGESK